MKVEESIQHKRAKQYKHRIYPNVSDSQVWANNEDQYLQTHHHIKELLFVSKVQPSYWYDCLWSIGIMYL